MDYEEKYKKALRWMQSLYSGLHGKTKEEAETYFPELKESEDEKIRKEIKVILANTDFSQFALDYTFADMLAWLEKQGEQKTTWNEEDEKILSKIQDHLREFYVDKKGYAYIAAPDSSEMIEYYWLDSIKDRVQPQPKQEWNEEDEKMFDKLYEILYIYGYSSHPEIDLSSNEAINLISWLKSLPPKKLKAKKNNIIWI